jgi:hypothetical protein
MSAIVNCPECRRALQVPDDFFGQKVQCPDCRHTFVAAPPEAAIQVAPPASAPASAPPVWEKDESPRDDRDRADDDRDDRRDDDDLDDLRIGGRRDSNLDPDRGGVILALGIVSLVLSFFSFMLYIVPIWIIPIILGVIGWIMGHRDLRAMKEGTMDRSNQVMTLIGMILSIVGVGISVCVALLSCVVAGFFGIMICGLAAQGPGGGRPGGPR